jgi:hypothetical protein
MRRQAGVDCQAIVNSPPCDLSLTRPTTSRISWSLGQRQDQLPIRTIVDPLLREGINPNERLFHSIPYRNGWDGIVLSQQDRPRPFHFIPLI